MSKTVRTTIFASTEVRGISLSEYMRRGTRHTLTDVSDAVAR